MTFKIKKHHQRGFTLVETLVAVMILASAIVGPLSIASRSLNNSIVAKDQITAFFLAQDAVEYVRYARDTNSLSGNDWLSGPGGNVSTDLSPCVGSNSSCYLDSTLNSPASPTSCSSGACPVMNYDSTTSRFTYATGSGIKASIFTRTISITSISATEAKLSVTVTWSDLGGVVRHVTVSENLFNWQ